ncbi:prostaglandin reductase 3 [Caerostris extrusa]|uniref:15-oxoprostaglandin 13-reductase n=1 Tax=Caerostris extrusa TaxID=172846 RepID=A0AAV4NYL3_CAEEX|nr:prostaglandin reductase 3 [Caerostris extrusa]
MSSKPKTFKRLMVQKLTSNFREAVSIDTSEICHPKEGEVCVRNKYVGINATDVNVTKGRYASVGAKLPFGAGLENHSQTSMPPRGFEPEAMVPKARTLANWSSGRANVEEEVYVIEGLGEIVEVGKNVKNLHVGAYVAYMNSRINSYAEYVCVPAEEVYAIPELHPDYLVLLVSGASASIGLDKTARITTGERVLITAAAGGAGHIAVQWAKAARCHVIGTCSTKEKEKILKELGCDRIINYKEEDLGEVLSKEYKKGIDVIWETIGGKVLETCMKNLAIKGRLVIVGGISSYKSEDKFMPAMDLSMLPQLVNRRRHYFSKSAAVIGFRRAEYRECFASYFKYMSEIYEKGHLKTITDNGEKSTGKEFLGLEGIIDGVEYLHSGKSIGKVVARLY